MVFTGFTAAVEPQFRYSLHVLHVQGGIQIGVSLYFTSQNIHLHAALARLILSESLYNWSSKKKTGPVLFLRPPC